MASRSPPDPIYVLRGTEAAINVLKFAPRSVREDGLLLSGSVKGTVNLWNLKTKRTEMTLDGHDGQGILAADFHPCGRVISHGRDGYVRTWQCSEGRAEVVNSITAPFLGFCQFCILPRGYESHWIALLASNQSQVNILDLDSKEILFSLKPENEKSLGMCMCLSMITSPTTDKPLLITGYENGQLVLWDIMAAKVLTRSPAHSESVLCMDVDKEKLQIVSGSADNKLCVSSITPEYTLSVDRQIELKNPGVASVKIRKDCRILATGGWDGRLRIYNWRKLTPLVYLSYHADTVNAVDFSENLSSHGQLLAAGGKDARITLWSLYNDK
ncbi:guanine nucleotide-binding protein subunit beta-like protein 1 isoform X2 [Orbicella faveolata]|uniref:guanine nucleotide-binding protein subunit beta-like protein 1 isoform X2 n=1 Tax=Orbicella faveolata TaxID=48498 RepID=UPI0009E568D4|nr:guanine nucleotide-binding protein subunit beta-like protein 1 isoform X2 [Orbicella faveolata]XP_020619143.1 guanine nucleotide-binding protein subunit beta-like protein 1 isoform X2 [Orbicella faveolata]